MPYRIYIPVFGSGLGHASRMAIIAHRLIEQGISIRFSSSGEAVGYLEREGFECVEVPGIDVAWSSTGALSPKRTVTIVPASLRRFAAQVQAEIKNILSFTPHLVLLDSRLSAVIASAIGGFDSITILNQLKILLPPRFGGMFKTTQALTAELLGLFWSICNEVLVPDLPPPYTISERTLWGVKTAYGKARYIGFMAPRYLQDPTLMLKLREELDLDNGKPIIFAQISGPKHTRRPLTKLILETAASDERYNFIISAGEPGGDVEPRRLRGGWYYEWCPVRDELFTLSNLLIIRGGLSSISQAILTGKPMITIPITDHSEQIYNAMKVEKLNIGLSLNEKELSTKLLSQTCERILNDYSYINNALHMKTIALKMNGVESVVEAALEKLGITI